MRTLDAEKHVQGIVCKHHLSTRGACNYAFRGVWGPREKSIGDPWTPSNPNGTFVSSHPIQNVT
ncbi:hypothetical protein BDV59DRAFT_174945, partial [Aspergillus ambiguus]|uniref:uncharacterized protein n=1 Tax=Aspergillus ambiguus TaxID=176160 RepID=UPI003CCD94C8